MPQTRPLEQLLLTTFGGLALAAVAATWWLWVAR